MTNLGFSILGLVALWGKFIENSENGAPSPRTKDVASQQYQLPQHFHVFKDCMKTNWRSFKIILNWDLSTLMWPKGCHLPHRRILLNLLKKSHTFNLLEKFYWSWIANPWSLYNYNLSKDSGDLNPQALLQFALSYWKFTRVTTHLNFKMQNTVQDSDCMVK